MDLPEEALQSMNWQTSQLVSKTTSYALLPRVSVRSS